MASSSSSSSSTHRVKFDVFLSFRGEDTRDNFTSHLYEALCRKQIETFIDYELKRGDEISPALSKAIEESKISLVIFSKDYASSKWCLDELAYILECKRMRGQIVVPVFYQVDPAHVRKQIGSFKDSFDKHEKLFKKMGDKVQKWRSSLTEASNLSGWDSSTIWPDSKLVDEIVKDMLKKLSDVSPPSSDFGGLIGIDSRVERIKSLLCIGLLDFRIVGIWGMGSTGKTTIAGSIFNQFSSQFEGYCFVANIREESEKCGGLRSLREKALCKILQEENLNIDSPTLPIRIKDRLRRKKVLVVFDDVNKLEQLEFLIGGLDRFGPGSRIVVTTRDKQVLTNYGVKNIYEVEAFNNHEALQIFCKYAFKQNHPPQDLMEISKGMVKYAKSSPLALKVLGSSLHRKSKGDWEEALNKLMKIPNPEIHKVLKSSYDVLDEEVKNIFLDIACFFRGEERNFVTKILGGGYFSPHLGLSVLVDKSLITIADNKLQMHDFLQEMGREVVRQESPKEPGKRSRLWNHEDVYHVLKKNTGTSEVEGIFLDMSKIREIHLSARAFVNMCNTKYLQFYNDNNPPKVHLPQGLEYLSDELRYLHWHKYPLKTLPSNFSPENLIELNLPYSNIEQLGKGTKDAFIKLKSIDLCHSRHLTGIADLLDNALHLEVIKLDYCTSLLDIPPSIHYIKNLTTLSAMSCESLRSFPSNIHFGSLETLDLSHCRSLTKFPQISGNIKGIYLRWTAIEEVPSSIEGLPKLSTLNLRDCKRLKNLPTTICKLESLVELDLGGCSKLESFPEILEKMECLEYLNLDQTAVKGLPFSIQHLHGLKELSLVRCENLETLPISICNLKSLKNLNLSWCSKLESFPEILQKMECLPGTAIKGIPTLIEHLNGLEKMDLNTCRNLETLLDSMGNMRSLDELTISGFPKHDKLLENWGNIRSPTSDLTFSGFTGLVWPPLSGLCFLKKLNLRHCNLVEIPEDLGCLSSLLWLDLEGNNFESIPTSMKKLSQLESLILSNCNMLQFLPELPPGLSYLEANHCKQLQSVQKLPSFLEQSNALELEIASESCHLRSIPFNFTFINCLKLNHTLAVSQLGIQQMATALLRHCADPKVSLFLPGSEIPDWFTYQSSGSSVTIKLSQHWFNSKFIGFALCAVIVPKECSNIRAFFRIEFKFQFETNYGDRVYIGPFGGTFGGGDDWGLVFDNNHIVIGYNPCLKDKLLRGDYTTALFEVRLIGFRAEPVYWKVKCCGVSPLYAEPNVFQPNITIEKFGATNQGLFVENAKTNHEEASTSGRSDEEEVEFTSLSFADYVFFGC